MTDPLCALSGPHRYAEDIRKSRFLAQAAPVDTAAMALAFIQQASDISANHNCWAFRIGQIYRFNDDGEPGGTAGRPILQAIEGQGIDHVVVLVTRWFGGIKLGAGGLVRAYGGTAAECLRTAARTPIVPTARLGVRAALTDLALLKARLKELDANIEQETFHALEVTLALRLPALRVAEAMARIVDITHGRSHAYSMDTPDAAAHDHSTRND